MPFDPLHPAETAEVKRDRFFFKSSKIVGVIVE